MGEEEKFDYDVPMDPEPAQPTSQSSGGKPVQAGAAKTPVSTAEALARLKATLKDLEAKVLKKSDDVITKVVSSEESLEKKVEKLGEDIEVLHSTVRNVDGAVSNVVDRVKEVPARLKEVTSANTPPKFVRATIPLLSFALIILVALGVLAVISRMPQSAAVAEEVKFAIQDADKGGLRQKDKEITELHAKVDRITDFLYKAQLVTKPDLIQVQKDLAAKVAAGAGGNKFDKEFKDLDKRIESVDKAVTNLKEGLPTQIRDLLVPIRNAVEKGQPEAKVLEDKLNKMTTALKDSIKTSSDAQADRLAKMEARISQLSEAMRLPREDQLMPVLFILEAGGRMLDHNHESARAAMLRALDESTRQTPARTLGLLVARGKDVGRPLKMAKHDPDMISNLRNTPEQLVPNATNEVAWEPAITQAITDALNMAQPRKRLVYVTCSPPIEAKLEAARYAGLAGPKGIEIWVIHLVRSGDAPSRDLSMLATETGGAYIVVQSLREDSARQRQANRRLESALFDALDLRAPETANK